MEFPPSIFKSLNGIFCLYKPRDKCMHQVRSAIQMNLARELNKRDVCPVNLQFHNRENSENEDPVSKNNNNSVGNLPSFARYPDLSEHRLVIGQRYEKEDFDIIWADALKTNSSGLVVLGIGDGMRLIKPLHLSNYMKVYHVKAQLGVATNDYWATGRTTYKTTYGHVNLSRLERLLSGIQANHQKRMFEVSGLDLQSQTAYEAACKGLMRPLSKITTPIIYGLRCIEFNPPSFTLEIHTINESCTYLVGLVHRMGVDLRSSASCTGLRRIRYGPFGVKQHALLLKETSQPEALLENILLCRRVLNGFKESIKNGNSLMLGSGLDNNNKGGDKNKDGELFSRTRARGINPGPFIVKLPDNNDYDGNNNLRIEVGGGK